jgi:hypothetical protein
MARSIVEERLAILEAEVAQLNRQTKTQKGWLEETFGVYEDFPEYDQVIEHGRQYRESLKSPARNDVA